MKISLQKIGKLLGFCALAFMIVADAASAPASRGARARGPRAAEPVAAAPASVVEEVAEEVVEEVSVDEAPDEARASMKGAGGKMISKGVSASATRSGDDATVAVATVVEEESAPVEELEPEPEPVKEEKVEEKSALDADGTVDTCKEDYFNCMDQFCLMGDDEGERCSCSSEISKLDKTVAEIKKLQEDAEKLMNEGVEREQLGAKADAVFGTNSKAPKKKTLDLSFMDEDDSEDDFIEDDEEVSLRGADLYSFAAKSCQDRYDQCGKDGAMVKTLYGQQVKRDCTTFSKYLDEQKKVVSDNKLAAEREVRKARFEMLDTTNKYNRGECLLALKDCVATKGGCGTNYENCLDEKLLDRRTNACENVLEQCMAVREYVLEDWTAEKKTIIAEAKKYADKNKRGTCLAQIEMCLEESCSPTVNDQCLKDSRIARGVCPIIDECNTMIPGIVNEIDGKLDYLRVRFCTNDLESCFKDKCGANYNNPACVGKTVSEISAMCPQDMFPSCDEMENFAAVQSGVFLQVDYQLMQGCINSFSEKLNQTCGMDMTCLDENLGAPISVKTIEELEKYDYKSDVSKAVEDFFAKLEDDPTIVACKGNLGTSIMSTAKLVGEMQANKRAARNWTRKLADLTKAADLETARKACEDLGKMEPVNPDTKIESVSFEPNLRNCHICRVEKVSERGGQSAGAGAMKGAAGGIAAGAGIGTKIMPGWGTAIGGAVGAIGGGLLGGLTSKEKTFDQYLTSCEDVNM